MSILGKYIDNIEDSELDDNRGFTLPAVVREDRESMTMEQAFFWSVVLHVALVLLTWLICLLMLFLGINFKMADKPNPKMKDIEFVLVENEAPPINKKTPYRADINSRAGGHHDPTRKVSMPSPAPSPSPKKAAAPAQPAAPAKQPAKQQPKPQPKPKTEPKKPSIMDKITKPTNKVEQPSPAPKAKEVARPNPPTARPSAKPPITPKTVQRPTTPFNVPVPKGGTKSGSYATGPISGTGKAANGGSPTGSYGSGSGGNHGKLAAAPSLAPTSRGTGSGAGSGKMGHGAGGSGYGGNPGPGNPNGRPGIDAIREPDFGPYMRELQRRIKMNWNPPKGNESKRVVLLFKIAKDGRLLSCSVFKSSGLPSADKAALDAVKLTAPFKPLPAEYKNSSIDIQFTFDYNVFGAGY